MPGTRVGHGRDVGGQGENKMNARKAGKRLAAIGLEIEYIRNEDTGLYEDLVAIERELLGMHAMVNGGLRVRAAALASNARDMIDEAENTIKSWIRQRVYGNLLASGKATPDLVREEIGGFVISDASLASLLGEIRIEINRTRTSRAHP